MFEKESPKNESSCWTADDARLERDVLVAWLVPGWETRAAAANAARAAAAVTPIAYRAMVTRFRAASILVTGTASPARLSGR